MVNIRVFYNILLWKNSGLSILSWGLYIYTYLLNIYRLIYKQCITIRPSISVRPFEQFLRLFDLLLIDLVVFILHRTDVF